MLDRVTGKTVAQKSRRKQCAKRRKMCKVRMFAFEFLVLGYLWRKNTMVAR